MRKKNIYLVGDCRYDLFFPLFFEGNLLPGKSSQPHKPEKMFSSLAINNEDRLDIEYRLDIYPKIIHDIYV